MVESVGRVFVAAGFPPEVRMAVADRLAGLPIPGSVVPADNLHVTFRFIGDMDEVAFDRLSAALDQCDLPAPFGVVLGGLGAFPKARNATVLWVDVIEGADRLHDLHEVVSEACEEAGLGPEERPFRPHVTVSRVRPPADVRSLVAATPPLGVRSRITELVVLRSHLGGGRPRYEPLVRFEL